MERLKRAIKSNALAHKDIAVYLFVEKFNYKNARELSILTGSNYSRLTQSLKTLNELELIDKTKETPARYFIKND